MAQTVKLKRSATASAVPTTGQLDLGEIAINTFDGKLFIKKDNGTPSIVEIGAGGGSGTVTSVAVSSANNALSISGSPITSSGTINLTANTFTSTDPGIVPASGGGTTNFLRADGTWAAAGGGSGTVTSVDVSGGTTGLTFTGGPVTTSGTITLSGVLDEVNGGTNQSTYATGDLLYASSSNTLSKLTVGTTGQVLTVSGGVPSWAAAAGGGSVYYKDPVRVATTANGTLASAFQNGSVVDGITLATGDRILIKNQTTATENGIYTVNASGAPTRATDMNENSESQRGIVVYVQFGNTNGQTYWQLASSNASGNIILGTSTNVWRALQGALITSSSSLQLSSGYEFILGTSTNAGLKIGGGTNSGNWSENIAIMGSVFRITTTGGGIAIGASATVGSVVADNMANGSIAIGRNAQVTITNDALNNSYSIAIGDGAKIGINSNTGGNTSQNAIAIGRNASVSMTSSTSNRNATGAVALGAYSSISGTLGGVGCIAIGYSSIAGTSSTANSSIAIGGGSSGSNSAAALEAGCIAIGFNSRISSIAGVAIGSSSRIDSQGQYTFSHSGFTVEGDIQIGHIPMYLVTTNNTPTELKIGNGVLSTSPTGVITLTNDSSYIFDCDIIARNTATDTESKAWSLKFAIRRGATASTTTLIGTATKTVIGEDTGTSTWDVSVTADTTNGRPTISVTGETSKTIRWVTNARIVKVTG